MNLNLGVVAFFQETKLERLLDLLTGAWRRRCPCASTESPGLDRGLRTVSYTVTSHSNTLLPTAGLGSLLWRLLLKQTYLDKFFDSLSFLTALPTVALPWPALTTSSGNLQGKAWW